MFIGRVIGNVVTTIKHSSYTGEKILMVKPVDPVLKEKNELVLAVDKVQAGVGDIVLVLKEGNSARKLMETSDTPVNTVIVGIVDEIQCKE